MTPLHLSLKPPGRSADVRCLSVSFLLSWSGVQSSATARAARERPLNYVRFLHAAAPLFGPSRHLELQMSSSVLCQSNQWEEPVQMKEGGKGRRKGSWMDGRMDGWVTGGRMALIGPTDIREPQLYQGVITRLAARCIH